MLKLISLFTKKAFKRVGAVLQQGAKMFLVQGLDIEMLVEYIGSKNSIVLNIYYAIFVKELLAEVALETMHTSKKL